MGKKGLGKVLAGAAVGVGIGMLLAPKSGEETRKDLKKGAEKVVKKVKEIDLNDLNNYPLLLQPKGNTTRDYLDSVVEKYGIYLEPEMTLSSYGLVTSMTKIGYGIGYLVEDFMLEYRQ